MHSLIGNGIALFLIAYALALFSALESDTNVPNGLVILEPGINYFRVCCNAKAISAFRLLPSFGTDDQVRPVLLFSPRPFSAFKLDEDELGTDSRLSTFPLIRENGFYLYKWYIICVHFNKNSNNKSINTDSSQSEDSSLCFTIRPCDCDCYSSSWAVLGVTAVANGTGLAVHLFQNDAPPDRFPGRVTIDIDLWNATPFSRCSDSRVDCHSFEHFSLLSDWRFNSSTSINRRLSVSAPEAISIRINLSVSIDLDRSSSYSEALRLSGMHDGPVSLIDAIDWNRSDHRFWILQPVRQTTPVIFIPNVGLPSLKPLDAISAKQLCTKWGNIELKAANADSLTTPRPCCVLCMYLLTGVTYWLIVSYALPDMPNALLVLVPNAF